VAGVAAIAVARPVLTSAHAKIGLHPQTQVLPPIPMLRAASLGYDAVVADVFWAYVLVAQGLRMGERRPFVGLQDYLEAIRALDPKFREPYRLADALLSYQVNDPDRAASMRFARQFIEKGLKERPFDSELWLGYGQFVAYIAPGSLPAEERQEWRLAGARALARAGELGANSEHIAFKAVAAVGRLTREGETDAAISFLERAYAMSDNEEVRADIAARLERLREGKQASRNYRLTVAFDKLWREDLPFASRAILSVLGPPVPVWACAGGQQRPACQRDWNAWANAQVAEGAEP
jgi:hypothetical protein